MALGSLGTNESSQDMITEGLMAQGRFLVPLRQDTPWDVRSKLAGWGYVVITPGELVFSGMSVDDLRSYSVFTGLVEQISGDMTSLSGPGLVALLGDKFRGKRDSGKPTDPLNFTGFFYGDAANTPTKIYTTRLAADGDLIPVPVASPGVNGITAGSISAAATTPSTVIGMMAQIVNWRNPHTRDVIDYVHANVAPLTSQEWRINADGTFDVDVPSALFADGAVLLSETVSDVGGIDASGNEVAGIPVTQSKITSIDMQDVVTGWIANSKSSDQTVQPGWATGHGASGTTYYDLRGGTLNLEGQSTIAQDDVSAADLTTIAADVALLHADPRRTVTQIITDRDVRRRVAPGDSVYVNDERRGLVDTANTVYIGGHVLKPLKLRVWEIEWPLVQGVGVYYIRGDLPGIATNRVVDLTRYVAYEPDTTTLTLGQRPHTISS